MEWMSKSHIARDNGHVVRTSTHGEPPSLQVTLVHCKLRVRSWETPVWATLKSATLNGVMT